MDASFKSAVAKSGEFANTTNPRIAARAKRTAVRPPSPSTLRKPKTPVPFSLSLLPRVYNAESIAVFMVQKTNICGLAVRARDEKRDCERDAGRWAEDCGTAPTFAPKLGDPICAPGAAGFTARSNSASPWECGRLAPSNAKNSWHGSYSFCCSVCEYPMDTEQRNINALVYIVATNMDIRW